MPPRERRTTRKPRRSSRVIRAEAIATLPPEDVSQWITIGQARGFVPVGPKALYAAIEAGQLQHSRVGRKILTTRAWLNAWLLALQVRKEPVTVPLRIATK
jgi:hypothetical protein